MNHAERFGGAEHIRSFVRREGRLTLGQRDALARLWPRFGITAETPLDPRKAFARDQPLALEIGFGAGENLLAQALARPHWNHIGVEVYRPGVGRLLSALEEAGLDNVRIYRTDAVDVLTRCVAPASLQRVQLLFPDPWPKKRHHKRRLVQPGFAGLVCERLIPGGVWQLATDWAGYAEHMLAVLQTTHGLANDTPAGGFTQAPPDRSTTRFERRGQKLGHHVFDLCFQRLQAASSTG